MKRLIAVVLILVGAAILAWAGFSSPRPPALPYQLSISRAPDDALAELSVYGVEAAGRPERLEIRTPGLDKPIATALAIRGSDGRLTPLSWRNAVTEPVFFTELTPADEAKVLTAIKEHAPEDAVIFAWWDMSRRIRGIARRQAPLDDPLARGLLTPTAWSESAGLVAKAGQTLWGAGASPSGAGIFGKFIDALLADEEHGAEALTALAGGKTAFIAVHLSDIWKAAAVYPDRIQIAYRDFANANGAHGVMKEARQWQAKQKIEGGYAAETIGTAIRLHYLRRQADTDILLARLLPFSTSNPMRLAHFELVFQHKGYWIYQLATAKP
jgi:hydroxylamine oxidation protein HaoB